MPQPTLSDVHVNVPLTNLTLAYEQEDRVFVANRMFPIIPVEQRSDVYYKYTRADFNRNGMKKRAPGTESAGGGYTMDNTGTYTADVWSLHKDIPDQVRANADAMLNLDSDATRWLRMQALISREVQFAATFFTTSVWSTQWAGVSSSPSTNQVLQWNDASSQPITDIRNMKRSMQLKNGGFRPNKLTLGRTTADVLFDHPDLVDRIKYGQTANPALSPAIVNLRTLAEIFELDEVMVMDAIINNGTEGQTAAISTTLESNAFIGDSKSALLVYTPPRPGLLTPGCGYTFAWTGYYGSTAEGTRMKSFYMPWLESTRVEIDTAYVMKVVAAEMGGFFTTVVA